MTPGFVEVDGVRIEHAWVGAQNADAPLIVFLHEGLGSLSMWKDFPQRLCVAAGCRGLVYSRPGYGQSTSAAERWAPDFMHREAYEVLPALLRVLHVTQPVWLFGHSDGGSIALLHAARLGAAGCIVLAPHVFVEDKAVAAIEETRQAFLSTDLRARLARYHDDPDLTFRRWNDIWLAPEFRSWNIEAETASITCPLLAIQGIEDEYGTLEQVHRLARLLPQTKLLELPQCGHSPHRDQPDAVINAAVAFIDTACR